MVVPLPGQVVTGRLFLFGKLPAHGDFVARGLSRAERDAWDAWLGETLEIARAELGAGFEDAYDQAPAWRFVRPELDGRWSSGALAPSMDAVGRRYPLVVGLSDLDAADAAARGAVLALGAEDAIRTALGDALDADVTLAGVRAEESSTAPAPIGHGLWWTEGGPLHAPAALSDARPSAAAFARALAPSRQPEPAR